MQINAYLGFNGQYEAAFTHYEKVRACRPGIARGTTQEDV